MFLRRFIFAAAAAMLVAAPAALAQQLPPLPSGGVIVQGAKGMQQAGHTHGHLCHPDRAFNGFRCVIGGKEWALLYFSREGNKAQGCELRLSQDGHDHFKLVQQRNGEFRGHCGVTVREQRHLVVYPAP
jgi:hypothetical protein